MVSSLETCLVVIASPMTTTCAFVTNDDDLNSPVPGGVQICSQEYLSIIRLAFEHVTVLNVSISKRLEDRLLRKTKLGSYRDYSGSSITKTLLQLETFRPQVVFINKVELLRIIPRIKQLLPGVAVIVLSHGNKSGDDLFEISDERSGAQSAITRFRKSLKLGLDIVTESKFRKTWIDGVCTMSKEECTIEHWLGCSNTFFFPRLIANRSTARKPISNRIGFIGTLDHPPNRVALEELFSMHLDTAREYHVRLIGGPEVFGRQWTSALQNVEYLGPLSDEEAEAEMSSWGMFLNPVFWLSRGASMKLATGLSNGIPVLTTKNGMRGYDIDNNLVHLCGDNAKSMRGELKFLLENPEYLQQLEARLLNAETIGPSNTALAVAFKQFVQQIQIQNS